MWWAGVLGEGSGGRERGGVWVRGVGVRGVGSDLPSFSRSLNLLHLRLPFGKRRRRSSGWGLSVDLVRDLVYVSGMAEVTVHEAKTHLSRLLRRVAMGEEIVISRGGEPVARLVPATHRKSRTLGIDRGKFVVPDDFDAPLPEDVLRDFED
jgi:prevent-host-death family protein